MPALARGWLSILLFFLSVPFLLHMTLSVDSQDCFTLWGPAGSGKSVLLEAVTGLIGLSSGAVRIGERDVSDLPPESRKLGLVHRDHALCLHRRGRPIRNGCSSSCRCWARA
jgi:ABC-type sugar transport system ATPase subunit